MIFHGINLISASAFDNPNKEVIAKYAVIDNK